MSADKQIAILLQQQADKIAELDEKWIKYRDEVTRYKAENERLQTQVKQFGVPSEALFEPYIKRIAELEAKIKDMRQYWDEGVQYEWWEAQPGNDDE